MDLIEFLRAQLDEDERIARLARPDYFTARTLGMFSAVGDMGHAIRHPPARVLREVAAKRAIIATCEEAYERQGSYMEDGQEGVAEDVLHCLAAAYSDHPDYRPEWKPLQNNEA